MIASDSSVSIPRRTTLIDRIAAGGAALRHRNFRLFFFGQLISLIGTWMQSLAQQWLVYSLTHSPLQLGIVSTLQFLPVLLFSLNAGVIVEALPKRAVIVATQIVFLVLSAILSVLVIFHSVQLWHVYVIAFLYGVAQAFDVPGRQSFVGEMVGKEDLLNAIALNSSIFNGSKIFGPALAAILIEHFGISWCFLLNTLSFIPVIAGLLMMHLTTKSTARPATNHPFRQIREGLQYIVRQPQVRLVFTAVTIVNIFGIPMYLTLMPIFATQVLHAGVSGLGMLNTGVGLGATIGALGLAYLPPGPLRLRIMLGGVLLLSIMLALFALSHVLWLSTVLIGCVGMCMVSSNSAGNAIVQSNTPMHLRARVMSVWGLVLIGFQPFGSFLAGALAQQWNAQVAVICGSFACLVGAIIVNVQGHRLREA